jgi:hypothetical protein
MWSMMMVRLPTRQRRRRLLGRSREAMAKPGGDDRRDLRVRVLLHLLVLGIGFAAVRPLKGSPSSATQTEREVFPHSAS